MSKEDSFFIAYFIMKMMNFVYFKIYLQCIYDNSLHSANRTIIRDFYFARDNNYQWLHVITYSEVIMFI